MVSAMMAGNTLAADAALAGSDEICSSTGVSRNTKTWAQVIRLQVRASRS